jgi:hypothetical protein
MFPGIDELNLPKVRDPERGGRKAPTKTHHSTGWLRSFAHLSSPSLTYNLHWHGWHGWHGGWMNGWSGEAILKELAKRHPLPQVILDHRRLSKALSTCIPLADFPTSLSL